MRTERTVLRLGRGDGSVVEVPMRYNASHQRGYRCFIGPLADTPEEITEETPRSFEARTLFDALAEYRKGIETEGWRLLHAVARCDCWPKPDELFAFVQCLRDGEEETERVDAFRPAGFAEVTTLAEQRAYFERWKQSLAPVYAPRVPRKRGHEQDEPRVEFSEVAKAAGEYLIDGRLNLERIMRRRPRPG